jgi:hypothetical protein
MRWLFALIAMAMFSVNACGGTGKGAGSASHASSHTTTGTPRTTASSATSTGRRLTTDRDGDTDSNGNSRYDNDDNAVLHFGYMANTADKRAIVALVKRYFSVAAAGDGARACSLMYSLLAEEVAEGYRRASVSSAERGKFCAPVMARQFKPRRHQLAADITTLKVTGVGVDGDRGLALLSFRTMPYRNILVHREFGTWKISALLDRALP